MAHLRLTLRVAAALVAAFLIAPSAFAQAVIQSGPILNGGGHAPVYMPASPQGAAQVMDSGPASGGPIGTGLSEKLLQAKGPGTGPDGTHDCDYSAYEVGNPTPPNWFCFDANALGGGLLDFNSPTGQPLHFQVNGQLYQFPFVVNPTGQAGVVSVTSFGAKCDGVTDDTSAIDNALAASVATHIAIGWPGTTCFSQSGVTGAAPASIMGSFAGAGDYIQGSTLACPNSIAVPCLKFTGGSGSLQPAQISNLNIIGIGSTRAVGGVGFMLQGGNGAHLSNMGVQNFDTCLDFQGVSNAGITTNMYDMKPAICNHKWVFDGYVDAHVFGGYAGRNGSGDPTTSADDVLFENTACNTGGCGPNTITFSGYDFISSGGEQCSIRFANFNAGTPNPNWGADITFSDSHFEYHDYTGSTPANICSDNTVPIIASFSLHHTTWTMGAVGGATVPVMYNLNSFTALENWNLDHNAFSCSSTALVPAPASGPAFENDNFDHNQMCGAVSYTANNASTANVLWDDDNSMSSLTVTGPWERLAIDDPLAGVVADTAATGSVTMKSPNRTGFPPVLITGGSSAGWTLGGGTSAFEYRTADGGFTEYAQIVVSGKSGTTSGAAQITGGAYSCQGGNVTNPVTNATNILGSPGVLGGQLVLEGTPGVASPISLTAQPLSGIIGQLNDTNIQVGTLIFINVHCNSAQ